MRFQRYAVTVSDVERALGFLRDPDNNLVGLMEEK
jgi:hypothetical protein